MIHATVGAALTCAACGSIAVRPGRGCLGCGGTALLTAADRERELELRELEEEQDEG